LAYPGSKVTIQFADESWLYDTESLRAKLSSGEVDVMEIDGLMLGNVADLLEEWPLTEPHQYFQAGIDAATLGGVNYGVPHIICTNFLFTYDEALASANNIDELAAAI
jgi:hypothetical protein